MKCAKHPDQKQITICPRCLGEKSSEKKAAQSRINGAKSKGRPRKVKP